MSNQIKRVDYFHTTVQDQPGVAFQILDQFAQQGVNLLAFSAVPSGPSTTQLTIFPDDTKNLVDLAKQVGLQLVGPYSAFIVTGDDTIGALAEIHKTLYLSNVNVYASNGLAYGKNTYGYIIYVKHEDYDRAAQALGI